MKIKTLLLSGALALSALFFTGCNTDDFAPEFLFQKVGGEYVVYDQAGNQRIFTAAQAEQFMAATPEQQAAFFRTAFPETYADPNVQPQLQVVEQTPPDYETTDAVDALTTGMQAVPVPYVGLAGLALSGIFAVWGAVMSRKKSVAEKSAIALVTGIDTFRNVVDQTPEGAQLDAWLKKSLGDAKYNAGVAVTDNIHRMVSRYSTPTQPSGPLVMPTVSDTPAS